jgi:hypothetical protein
MAPASGGNWGTGMRRIVLAMVAVSCAVASMVVVGSERNASAAADDAIPGDPSVPVASGTPLPFDDSSSWGDIAVDEAHGHVFVSGGQGTTGVVVTDLDGQILETIPDLAGAEGMVLSQDGSTLYVALVDGKAIAAVDTATLGAQIFPTGDACPRHLAQLGNDVYFTESCLGTYFQLMRLDPVSGQVDPVTLAGEPDQVFREYGNIAAHPSQPGRLFVVDNEYSTCCRPSHAVSAFEVDGATATRVATRVIFVQHVYGLDFLDDGSELIVVGGDGLTALGPTDLSVVRDAYTASEFGTTWAVSASGNYVASTTRPGRIEINDRAGGFVRSYFFDAPTNFLLNGVELTGDRVYAVASHDDGSTIRLHALTDVTTPAPDIWHSGVDGTRADDPVHFSGTAMLLGEPFAGHELTVWRYGVDDGWVSLPSVVTAADGTFAIDDTPGKGNYSYVVLYPGAPGVAPAKHQWHHTVSGLNSAISLDPPEPSVFRPGETTRVSGSLTRAFSDEPIVGATVTLTQTHNGQELTLPSVTTGPDGVFSFETTGEDLGEHQVTAVFAGDSTWNGSVDHVSLWVKQPAVIELRQPLPYALVDEAMRFEGRLTTHDGQPLANQRVSWGRYPGGRSNPQETGSRTTDAEGYFSFTDQATESNATRWGVSWAGDATNDVAGGGTSLPVYLTTPQIEIRTNRPVHTYGTDAAVEAWLPDGLTLGTVKLYVQPFGEGEDLLAEGQATTGADAVGSTRVTRNATLTAVYEPQADRYTYAPHRVSVSMLVRPRLQQTLQGSYRKERRTYLVRTRVDPRLNLQVAPTLPGRCVRVHVERYRNGAYKAVQDTPCIPLNQYSRASWKLTSDPPAGARFRLHYDLAGDEEYAAAAAPWVNLRFTR